MINIDYENIRIDFPIEELYPYALFYTNEREDSFKIVLTNDYTPEVFKVTNSHIIPTGNDTNGYILIQGRQCWRRLTINAGNSSSNDSFEFESYINSKDDRVEIVFGKENQLQTELSIPIVANKYGLVLCNKIIKYHIDSIAKNNRNGVKKVNKANLTREYYLKYGLIEESVLNKKTVYLNNIDNHKFLILGFNNGYLITKKFNKRIRMSGGTKIFINPLKFCERFINNDYIIIK